MLTLLRLTSKYCLAIGLGSLCFGEAAWLRQMRNAMLSVQVCLGNAASAIGVFLCVLRVFEGQENMKWALSNFDLQTFFSNCLSPSRMSD